MLNQMIYGLFEARGWKWFEGNEVRWIKGTGLIFRMHFHVKAWTVALDLSEWKGWERYGRIPWVQVQVLRILAEA